MFFRLLYLLIISLLVSLRIDAQTSCAMFSTYFGGAQFDEIKGVCADANKNSYIIGNTYSTALPVTLGLINDTASGDYDVFLAKIDSCGGLVWCTYFGSTNFDSGEKIKISNDGNIVFCGYSNGTNLPTTNGSFQSTNHGGYDCFVTKISPAGTIIWSSYFGQSNGDFAYDITTDALNNIIIGGTTTSPNLYTSASSFQQNIKANTDAFIARFNKQGTLKWCTYYGGNNNEDIHAITTDNNYNIIGVGGSFSSNLNTSASAYQAYNDGGADVYILKLDSNCTRIFSSYLGGSGVDDAWGVTTDSFDNIYLSGHTTSFDFDTTVSAYQTTKLGSLSDWYLTKWSSTGILQYSTLYGGANNDLLARMAFVAPDKILLIGKSESTDIPVLGTNNQTTLSGNYDGFLVLFDINSMFPFWSSYYGGSLEEDPLDIVCNSVSSVIFVGNTNSTNYPISASPYQSSLNMSNDGFITKLSLQNLIPTTIDESFFNSSTILFPNPFDDVVHVEGLAKFSIRIDNIFGQCLLAEKNKKTIFVKDLQAGVYFVTISSGSFSKTQKLIKQ